jgi:hypothetical protein
MSHSFAKKPGSFPIYDSESKGAAEGFNQENSVSGVHAIDREDYFADLCSALDFLVEYSQYNMVDSKYRNGLKRMMQDLKSKYASMFDFNHASIKPYWDYIEQRIRYWEAIAPGQK